PCCTTLERKNPNDLCRETDAWFPSTHNIGGTPGFENSVFSTDETIFELLSASVVSLNEVELHFSGKTDSASLVNASVSIGNSNLNFASSNPSFSTGIFASNTDFERGKVYEIQVGGIEDCAGFATNTFSTEVYLHQSGDVILNEVLFDPTTTGSDFVELKNTTAFDISLNGWSFGYYNTEDSLIYLPFESTANIISSAQHLALTEAPNKVISDYPNAVAENVVLNDLPSLSNDAGSVMIFDQFDELMDQFDYTADMHFALLDVVDGVSLERISSTQATNDGSNWHSASSAVNFATPGYENSQNNEAFVAETIVSLTSEFVSPDNDGYQDVVGISYQLTDPGYSISIKVFNDKGYEIKTVASNELIGASGVINWDGTNDLNEKADIGIHVVYVMLFDLKGVRQEFRLPVVVSSKL
ncbi:MAG: lamin tail domain-containing protein, partial [Salibacteraceae bacterium]|nr:lamin tail domain-containing protein [Salibacteraceae bacterium]